MMALTAGDQGTYPSKRTQVNRGVEFDTQIAVDESYKCAHLSVGNDEAFARRDPMLMCEVNSKVSALGVDKITGLYGDRAMLPPPQDER
jgi:hypothetical protein